MTINPLIEIPPWNWKKSIKQGHIKLRDGHLPSGRQLIIAATSSLVIAAALVTYSLVWRSWQEAAGQALAATQTSLARVERSYSQFNEDSREQKITHDARASYEQAEAICEGASLLRPGDFDEAQASIHQADAALEPLLTQLDSEYEEAGRALKKRDYAKAFAFVRTYPQADEAATLLADAEESPFASLWEDLADPHYTPPWEQAALTLERIHEFMKYYPGTEIPRAVIARTGDLLIDLAVVEIAYASTMLEKNIASLDNLSATGQRQLIMFLPDTYKEAASKALALLPGLGMPPEMSQLYQFIAEANAAASDIHSLFEGAGGTMGFYESSRFRELNDIQSTKVSQALTLLKEISDRYFKGSKPDDIGVLLGNKILKQAVDAA